MNQKVIPLKALEAWLSMIWESDHEVRQAARFIQAILAAGSARLTDIARELPGKEASSYKALGAVPSSQRAAKGADAAISGGGRFHPFARLRAGSGRPY